LLALALSFSALGCLPKIGDHCTTSLECSATGQKICDVTQPNGYCTVFNCEPDTCPDSATCVAFNNTIDNACQNTNAGSWPRFERSFCMAPCSQDSDCRGDTLGTTRLYACVAPPDRGGVILDVTTASHADTHANNCPSNDPQCDCKADSDCDSRRVCRTGRCVAKVCVPAASLSVPDPSKPTPGVCEPGKPGSLPDPYESSTGSGGTGGSGGSGGTGGASGTGGVAGAGGSGGSGGTGGMAGAGGSSSGSGTM
jgi:hypothetical protein